MLFRSQRRQCDAAQAADNGDKSCLNAGEDGDLAYARSGDKGTGANIGVVARTPDSYDMLVDELTAERVAEYFGPMGVHDVIRYELPNLQALNFVVKGILSRPLRVDAQGKALGQALLEMPWPPGKRGSP